MATMQSLIPTIPNFNLHSKTPRPKNNNIITYVNMKPLSHYLTNNNNNFACSLITTQQRQCHSLRNSFVTSVAVANRGGGGGGSMMSGSFGSVTLKRPKPELAKKTGSHSFEEKFQFDDTGDGGNGNNKVGGGDNGGGGFGDDDDYFDFDDNEEDDGGQGGWFRRRIALSELYNRVFIESVLNEWQKTLKDLPDGIRLACELGAMSSAQLVRYLMNEARPTITRAISRTVSKSMSAAFIGRITADPAFLHKLLFEQFVTVVCSIRSEFKRRGERIRQEWDLALINVLTVAACNLVVVWSLAPCCSYEKVSRFHLQNTLHKLPNNMFETSYHHKRFDVYQRIQSFVCKAVQFSLVGFTAGAVQTFLSNLCAKNKEGRLSVQIPPANTNALGYGAFLGIYTNWRYQMLCGMDKVLTNHFEVIGVSLFLTAAFRILNAQLGDISKAAWLDTANFVPLPDKALNEKAKRKKSRKEQSTQS